jgi:hypothetical protein
MAGMACAKRRSQIFPVRKKRIKEQPSAVELLPCMAYLHGDIVDDQFRAACQYEYARESNVLRKAAELVKRDPSSLAGEIVFQIDREFPAVGSWLISTEWRFVWQCPSFPAKSWNQLIEKERSELLYGLPLSKKEARPLVLGEVMFLTHYLDQLKEMADKGRTELEAARAAGRPRKKVYPVLPLPNTPFVQVLLPLDFSKSKKRLLEEIGKWLDLPENKDRFDKHQPKTEAGTEKEAKDRLKDLAAWRVYRELGYDKALRFCEENRKRDESGTLQRFHDWRQDQTKKIPPNEAPLYSEESGFSNAKKRAEGYLAQLVPWEFGEYAQEREQQKREWAAAFRKALEEAAKISKSSS